MAATVGRPGDGAHRHMSGPLRAAARAVDPLLPGLLWMLLQKLKAVQARPLWKA